MIIVQENVVDYRRCHSITAKTMHIRFVIDCRELIVRLLQRRVDSLHSHSTAIITSSHHKSTQTDVHPVKALAAKILAEPVSDLQNEQLRLMNVESLVNTLAMYRPQLFSIAVEAINIDMIFDKNSNIRKLADR